ncbi:hypothetical protein [Natronorubrum halophilum]|uniref:hypothetical protein n=1 Tax=Natronorubrum halophilum TaxID=1702106 RepID=UPI0013CF2B05|nr:hypothetical protein [Natronorubrum halophilum]
MSRASGPTALAAWDSSAWLIAPAGGNDRSVSILSEIIRSRSPRASVGERSSVLGPS